MSFAYELGCGCLRAGNRVYSASFTLLSIKNHYGRDKYMNVIYRIGGYWVDNDHAEEKEIPEKIIEFYIRGIHKEIDTIGKFMTEVLRYSDNLSYLLDTNYPIGELKIPFNIPDVEKIKFTMED